VTGYFYPSKGAHADDEETKAAQAQQRFKRSLELRVVDYVDNLDCACCGTTFEEGRVVSSSFTSMSHSQLVCHHSPYCETCLGDFLCM
jgi:hypothetical protein